jgi:glutamate-1-semialdehyde 2,1-aminomutase
MEKLSPVGPVYQAGTLSGNPLAVAAGRATLQQLTPSVYARLEAVGAAVEAGISAAVAEAGCSLARVGSMFTVFFRSVAPENLDEVRECDFDAFGRFHRAALDAGVYLPPSQYEAAFLSATLSEQEIATTINGIVTALRGVDAPTRGHYTAVP